MHEPLSARQRFWRNIRKHMLAGILFVIPLGVTAWILELLFKFVGGLLGINGLAGRLIGSESSWVPFVALTIGFIATLLLIYLIGILAANVVGRRLLHWGETLLMRLPIVKSIYGTTKEVMKTLSLPEGSQFKSVVLVQFPGPGLWALGFNTGTICDNTGKVYVKVYVPTTPTPNSGFLEFLPQENVRETNISFEDAIKMIISGGIISPEKFDIRS